MAGSGDDGSPSCDEMRLVLSLGWHWELGGPEPPIYVDEKE